MIQDLVIQKWLFVSCECGVACSDVTERERLACEGNSSGSVSAETDWTAGEQGFVSR